MLKERQEKILLLMKDLATWCTGKEIAKYMNVTDRTIRCDIHKINAYYKSPLIESHKRYGYRLNQHIFQHLDLTLEHQVPQLAQERCTYIIRDLLFHRGNIHILDLQNELYVSDYSIDMDLKKIKTLLKQYDTLILHRSKNCIQLEGSEHDKRSLYKDILKEQTQDNFLNLDKLASFFNDFDLLKVKELLESIFKKHHFVVQEITIPLLILHIGISIQRNLQHHFLPETVQENTLKNCIEYEIATDFYIALSKYIRIEIIESEISQLAFFLMDKKSIVHLSHDSENPYERNQIVDLVNEIILHIRTTFDFDLSFDEQFKKGLIAHLLSLLDKNEKQAEPCNVYLHEIKRKYPLIFEMGIYASKFIGEKLKITLSEDEIGFIALHLGGAYERNNKNHHYRAILIYPQDQPFFQPCIEKLTTRFANLMVIETSLSFFEESIIEECKPDLILTTLPLRHNLEIITIQISLFVDYDDEMQIYYALKTLDQKRLYDEFSRTIPQVIDQRFFYYDLDYKKASDVIQFLSDDLKKSGIVDDSFIESIFQNETISSTSFIYNFALPHTLHVASRRSIISISILKNAIHWGDYEVKLVLLFAMQEKDLKLIRLFFDWFNGISGKGEQFNKLCLASNAHEFIQTILNKGEES